MRPLDPAWTVSESPGVVTVTNANTTLGYCRHDGHGEIEYLFVHSGFRRRGIARALLRLVEARTGRELQFQRPLSPLGRALEQAYLKAPTRGCTHCCSE